MNVGFVNFMYFVFIIFFDDIIVIVKLEQLIFSVEGEKQSFILVVLVISNFISIVVGVFEMKFVFLVWIDGSYVVQSFIVIIVEQIVDN